MPLARPFVGTASAAWESPSEEEPLYFWSGEGDPNDQTTDPDEPFDGLDRIVFPEKSKNVVTTVRASSFMERFAHLMQSLWMLKG
jgi:hypothetical protein